VKTYTVKPLKYMRLTEDRELTATTLSGAIIIRRNEDGLWVWVENRGDVEVMHEQSS